MTVMVDVKSGKITGGNFTETLAVRLCLIASRVFALFKFRGYWRINKIICRALNITERQWITLPNGVKFSIDLTEPYWNRLISPKFDYEPELTYLLQTLKDVNYSFIDCGANIGYWSCLAASEVFGQKSVHAIEPFSDNFKLLEQHAKYNKQEMHLHKSAISDQRGHDIPLFKPGSHASVSLVSTNSDIEPSEVVQTITIDDIYREHLLDVDNIFLKLDVEGVEIKALKGATELLRAKQPLVLYEDHSDDKESSISEYVINEMGYAVLYIDNQLKCHEINSVAQINDLKVLENHGYNFLAFHPDSEFSMCVRPANVTSA